MRLLVIIGRDKIIVPGDATRTVGWLCSEVSWRYNLMQSQSSHSSSSLLHSNKNNNSRNNNSKTRDSTHVPDIKTDGSLPAPALALTPSPAPAPAPTPTPAPAPIQVVELRTHVNGRLYVDDQLMDVVKDGDTLIAITAHNEHTSDKKGGEAKPGDMILHYHLLELIGEGTYGLVFKGKDLNINRYVAVKVLRRSHSNTLNTRRFLREAELNGQLSHCPYICTVFDFGRTERGHLFIVMELLRGLPLNALLDDRITDRRPFTARECISILVPVLKGLHTAHTAKPAVVHRDLKPDNIWLNEAWLRATNQIPDNEVDDKDKEKEKEQAFINEFGLSSSPSPSAPHLNSNSNSDSPSSSSSSSSPSSSLSSSPSSSSSLIGGDGVSAAKIMDFGIAVQDDTATQACGTRMYSSPEQVRKHGKVDARSDIWSVGVVLYQLLTLLVDVPFDPVEINVHGARVPDVRLHAVSVISDHLASICMRALQVHPGDRWQTASQMLDALLREEVWLRQRQEVEEAEEAEQQGQGGGGNGKEKEKEKGSAVGAEDDYDYIVPRPLSLSMKPPTPSLSSASSPSLSKTGVCPCRCQCACKACFCLVHGRRLNRESWHDASNWTKHSMDKQTSFNPSNKSMSMGSTPIMLSDPSVPGNGRALSPLSPMISSPSSSSSSSSSSSLSSSSSSVKPNRTSAIGRVAAASSEEEDKKLLTEDKMFLSSSCSSFCTCKSYRSML